TASVAGTGVYESIARLHMRYYNFAFPLLLLVAASQLTADSDASAPGYRAVAAIPLGAAAIFGLYTQLAPFAPSLVDSPELRGFASKTLLFQLLGAISLLSLAVWIYSARTGARCFVYLFIPLCAIVSS